LSGILRHVTTLVRSLVGTSRIIVLIRLSMPCVIIYFGLVAGVLTGRWAASWSRIRLGGGLSFITIQSMLYFALLANSLWARQTCDFPIQILTFLVPPVLHLAGRVRDARCDNMPTTKE